MPLNRYGRMVAEIFHYRATVFLDRSYFDDISAVWTAGIAAMNATALNDGIGEISPYSLNTAVSHLDFDVIHSTYSLIACAVIFPRDDVPAVIRYEPHVFLNPSHGGNRGGHVTDEWLDHHLWLDAPLLQEVFGEEIATGSHEVPATSAAPLSPLSSSAEDESTGMDLKRFQ